MSYKQARAVNQGVFYTLGSYFSTLKASEFTYIFVWNPASLNPMGLMRITHGGSASEGVNPYSDGKFYYSVTGFAASSASYTATDGWRIDVIRKGPGSGITPRHSYYLYSEGVWHHSNFTSAMNDSATTGFDGIQLWAFSPGSAEVMDGMAAGFCMTHSILADGDCDGLELGIPEWVARGYDWMVSHQESPNETSASNTPAKPFGAHASGSAFVSFGQFGAGGITWPQGYNTAGILATDYNPPSPWSYARVAQGDGTHSGFQQRATFKGTRGDAAGWTLGNQMSCPGDGSVTAIWWYPPDSFVGDFTWRLYHGYRDESPHTLLATGTVLAANFDTNGGWQKFDISPVDVSGTNFIVCYDAPGSGNGSYVYGQMNGDAFPSPGGSGGVAWNDGVLYVKDGCFASSHAKPDTEGTNLFGIDVELTPAGAPPPSYNGAQFFPYFD